MLQALMFCLLKFTGAAVGSHETTEAEVSRDAILPCRLRSSLDMNRLSVEWKHNGVTVHRYRSLNDDPVQDENFKNRTSLFKSEMPEGNVSLKLTNVTERDAGNYSCDVRIKDPVKTCIVTLIVVDKKVRMIQDPSPTPKQPVNQGLSIWAIIGITVVVVAIVAGLAIGFGVWKPCKKPDTEQEPKKDHGPNRRRNKRGRNKKTRKRTTERQWV